MKKVLNVMLAIVILTSSLFTLTGCENNNNNNDINFEYQNMTAEDLLSKIIKDRNNVTSDEYVRLVSTYSNVNIKEDLTLEKKKKKFDTNNFIVFNNSENGVKILI